MDKRKPTSTATALSSFQEKPTKDVWGNRDEASKSSLSRIKALENKTSRQGKKIEFTFYLMIGMVIVVGLGFIQLLISYYAFVQNSYSEYRVALDKVTEERNIIIEERLQQLERPTETAKTETIIPPTLSP